MNGDLAAVTDRLDLLTRKLARVSQTVAPRDERPAPRRDERRSSDRRRDLRDEHDDDDFLEPAPARRDDSVDRVAEVIARLDRRLDEVIAESRAATTQIERRVVANEQDRRAAADDLERRAAAITEMERRLATAELDQASAAAEQQQRAAAEMNHRAAELARMERRLAAAEMDQLSAGAEMQQRVAAAEMERRAARATLPPSRSDEGPNNWAMEISARQRALDEDAYSAPDYGVPPPAFAVQAPVYAAPVHAAPPVAYAPAPVYYEPEPTAAHADRRAAGPMAAPAPAYSDRRNAAPDLSGLENQLRNITHQIATLQQPYDDVLTALRTDLAEIGRSLTDALPRHAVEALENEVRSLAGRVDQGRQAGIDAPSLGNLERGLAEIRDALRTLTPAESLVGVDEAVRGLSRKIDQISANSQDASSFQQIEHAIVSLRGVVANVASDGALAQLAAEVHSLARNFEHAAKSDNGSDALARLDARIAALVDSDRNVPPHLEASIRTLSDRLERMQLSQGDQLALGSLEDRIVKLFEKLDASDARLGSLGAIERGVTDLLVAVEDIRASNGSRGLRAAPAPAPAAVYETAPMLPPAAQLQLPAGAVSLVPEPMPAAAPQARPMAQPAAPAPRPQQAAPHPVRERKALDPNLAFDAPLEPGSGAPRSKPSSPAARIAASEAAIPAARRGAPDTGTQTAAAARNAAKSAIADAPAPIPAATKAKAPPVVAAPPAPVEETVALDGVPLRKRLAKQAKTVLVAGSVVVIVLGVLHAAMDFVLAPSKTESGTSPAPAPLNELSPPADTAPAPARPAPGGRSMPTPDGAPAAADPEPTGQIGRTSSMFDPNSVLSRSASADITGSLGRPATKTAAATPAAAPISIPASFGPVLRAAAATNDPGADYEIAMRYAEGRGVTRSADEAVRWLERAAKNGFAPAEFRLASLNEKGEGVRKDLQAARRLYIAAADRGHAKAMHNLAVLHAEGIDGKPDYKVATEWFRKAAAYGVADSQYNLAILYARGIGVEQNLAESYKWFALAAARGDADAGKKRDEVAARLDQTSLTAAKLAVQNAATAREPDDAVNLRIPPGGWDRAATATTAQPVRTRPKTSTNP